MSISIALKNLLKDRVRLLLSILGVALAVMLVLILDGFVSGLYKHVSAYLDNSPGSIVVTQKGVNNLLGATSLLPPETEDRSLEIEGVTSALPILSQFVILDLHDLKQPAYMIGYPEGQGGPGERGGPWRINQGREPLDDDEMVFDRVLADRHNLGLGDYFELMGREFKIVGLSEDTTSWMTSFFFIRKSAAESLLRAPEATSILLVQIESTADQAEVLAQLNQIEGVDALTKSTIIANDTKLLVEVFSAPLQLMAGISFIVGVLVVGLVIYTATVERRREYGVLKAIGARNSLLYMLVLVQAVVASGLGAVSGIGLGFAFAQLIMGVRPEFLIILESNSAVLAIGSGLAMSVLAAIIPARNMAGLEPAQVFRRGS
jgi:putative ABC transport system permease protein